MTLTVDVADSYVSVAVDPCFSDDDVIGALADARDAGCVASRRALELLDGRKLDMLASQPGYVHGPVRLYRDGAL